MKTFLMTLLLVAFSYGATAQEIYKIVYKNAEQLVNNPTTSLTMAKIAQFKLSELTYLRQKAFETMPEVTDRFLDVQAYYLSNHLNLCKNLPYSLSYILIPIILLILVVLFVTSDVHEAL